MRKQSAGRHRLEGAKKKGRSRLSNGHVLPSSVDLRSRWARRFRDLLTTHLNDLGGPAAVSEAEKAIVRRAAALMVELERMEECFALNGCASPDELELYQRCSNTMKRLLEAVGLERRPRDVTPSLQTYLRAKQPNGRGADGGLIVEEVAR